jgi:hypothetical protein
MSVMDQSANNPQPKLWRNSAAPNPENRRRERRFPQPNRIVLMQVNGRETHFFLDDLSARGAGGQSDAKLLPGQTVTFVFEDGQTAVGRVRWTRGFHAGIQFMSPLAPDLLERPSAPDGARREARFSVLHSIKIVGRDGKERPVTVHNLSRNGMLVEAGFTLLAGQRVQVRYGEARSLEAQVLWSRGGRVGLLLVSPIPLDDFHQMIAEPR